MAAHAQTFLAQSEAAGAPLPSFVQEEFDAYLACGILSHGFSLHAGVRCETNDRQGLEQLARYITRPATSNERLAIHAKGQIALKLKTPWRDGVS